MSAVTSPGRPAGDVLVLATKGHGSNEESRVIGLSELCRPEIFPFQRASKAGSGGRLLWRLARRPPSLVVMEGTGLAAGLVLIAARLLGRTRYLVSSGDAVGPFFALRNPLLRPVGAVYERLLYRLSSGFIGWTPYFTGRAIALGAPRGVTAENWSLHGAASDARAETRDALGIADGDIAFGIVGALNWSARHQFCYGAELVRAVAHCGRTDIVVVIVGGGTGLEQLRREAEEHGVADRVRFTGPVPHSDVPAMLSALDVGSLPQSLDGVGILRYTTKVSEYAAARIPIVTGRLPFAYDLADEWTWRLPGREPWGERYADALGELMRTIDRRAVDTKRAAMPTDDGVFSKEAQQRRVGAFIEDVLADAAGR